MAMTCHDPCLITMRPRALGGDGVELHIEARSQTSRILHVIFAVRLLVKLSSQQFVLLHCVAGSLDCLHSRPEKRGGGREESFEKGCKLWNVG